VAGTGIQTVACQGDCCVAHPLAQPRKVFQAWVVPPELSVRSGSLPEPAAARCMIEFDLLAGRLRCRLPGRWLGLSRWKMLLIFGDARTPAIGYGEANGTPVVMKVLTEDLLGRQLGGRGPDAAIVGQRKQIKATHGLSSLRVAASLWRSPPAPLRECRISIAPLSRR